MTDFTGLELAQPLLRAIADEGYTTPSPIQGKAIPPLMEGRDLLGVAQTGTGKTAAFSLPLLHRLDGGDEGTAGRPHSRQPRALILAPTRELAGQIVDSLKSYSRHMHIRTAVVFGGVSIKPQIKTMNSGVHILVATPGRLLDLMNQGFVQLDKVEFFILDEADRMLDMGFQHDVKKIAAKVPAKRQTMLFSATMPKSVQGLASSLLNDPVRVEAAPAATTAEKVEQQVLYVSKDNKRNLLGNLLKDSSIERVLVFTRTKHRANRVAKHLVDMGITADAIHGNKAQNARQRALDGFKKGSIRVLVATDIAARGIDVDGVTHVINFELPNEPESYVHRIGRTARAGADGIAISFCDHEERGYLRDIEKTIRQTVTVMEDHPYHAADVETSTAKPPAPGGRGSGRGQQKKRTAPKPGQKSGQNGGQRPSSERPAGQRRRRPNRSRRTTGMAA
ncbi:MAG: DEAD/DEAH box helicase [Alphaproteobacteria bacterium]|jgi:ATP-dependent RNA helicase RhlE|nr:DEAD/DEAH box helicase [Alphaproteobacteria bacterium]MBT4082756.1 DEAD/DEAH box helicase [Alphaproteobacteria bacterium]MBT4543985.1 DEAD/DEAH box helicase [Alphaproteobacteria bacterium]MBT6387774.1 DEAD/DEAH box helicase [Alphaproteobacteria bacterium]MBT7745172.1 DEAD/DEAH box helicase [Alphaproteobacteria bacterium]